LRFERVLALSPHTDDVELGAGGTVARLVEEGAVVYILAFSSGKATEEEQKQSATVLNVEWDLLDFQTRTFPTHRHRILDAIRDYGYPDNPDLVICPSSFDFHQDHEVIRAEAQRAFRTCTILGYELPWSCRQFDAQCLVRLLDDEMNNKVEAVNSYVSQANKRYTSILWDLARMRGSQIGAGYAEAFEVIRWVL